jgi:hypothetical protein
MIAPCENLGPVENFDLLLTTMQPYIDILEASEDTKFGFLGRTLPDGSIDYGEHGTIKPAPDPSEWTVWREGVDKDLLLSYIREYERYNFARIRLLKMLPNVRHYSWHKDPSARLHIPLITNPDAVMSFMVEDEVQSFHLTPGNLWLTRTKMRHTALNKGITNRYHIVYEFFT